jgi:hypothetical protein
MNDFEYEVLRTISLVKKGMTMSDILREMSAYNCSDSELKSFLDKMHSKDILKVQNMEGEDGKMRTFYCLNSNKFKTTIISNILNELIYR